MHLPESDTRAKFIDPKLKESGREEFVICEHYFTDGRKFLGGKRGQRLFVDYLLRYKNSDLTMIESPKLGKYTIGGLQQAIRYADKLKVKFIFATNGEKIYQFLIKNGTGNYIEDFHTHEVLFQKSVENLTSLKNKLLAIPFYLVGDKQLIRCLEDIYNLFKQYSEIVYVNGI